MRYELIIFDCDGVLVDSEPVVNRVYVEMLGELGHALDYETTLREFSGGSTAIRLAVTREKFGWSVPEGFVDAYNQRLLAALQRELRPVPGIRDVLEQVGGPWCVASNGTHGDIRSRLELAGLLAHFEPHLFSATQVAHGKPAPDLFLYAAQAMGVSPQRCAVVEDSVPGVTAAVRANMAVFGFARLTPAQALRDAGARAFESMSDLPHLLRPPGG